jgi:hypothetical protein
VTMPNACSVKYHSCIEKKGELIWFVIERLSYNINLFAEYEIISNEACPFKEP